MVEAVCQVVDGRLKTRAGWETELPRRAGPAFPGHSPQVGRRPGSNALRARRRAEPVARSTCPWAAWTWSGVASGPKITAGTALRWGWSGVEGASPGRSKARTPCGPAMGSRRNVWRQLPVGSLVPDLAAPPGPGPRPSTSALHRAAPRRPPAPARLRSDTPMPVVPARPRAVPIRRPGPPTASPTRRGPAERVIGHAGRHRHPRPATTGSISSAPGWCGAPRPTTRCPPCCH